MPYRKDSTDGVALVQKDFDNTTKRQQWKITKTSRGLYKIKAKSSEDYTTDFCMAAGDGILTSNGRNVEQRVYSNNTDLKDEWVLEEFGQYRFKLLALNENNIERNKYFSTVSSIISSKFSKEVYTDFYSSVSEEDMMRYLCDSDIFIVHTHGRKDGFYISTSNYLSMSDINNLNLDGLKFALLLTCNTGKDFSEAHINNNKPVNIVEKMVCRGAETVVGFSEVTYVSDCNLFAEEFISATVKHGKSVKEAISEIDGKVYLKSMSDISTIGGNEDLYLD